MKIKELESKILTIKNKGYHVGLTRDDYKELAQLLANMDPHLVATDERWHHSSQEVIDIMYEFFLCGLLHTFGGKDYDYISKNASLLPLVLANDLFAEIRESKMSGDNSYMFLCQFHNERTPSMSVSDFRNRIHCFGCGASFNVISYLQQYENLQYKEAMQLLCQIYLFNIKKEEPRFTDLVHKYQESILSKKYIELLERGKYRLKKRYGNIFCGQNIDEWYDAKFQMIERIRIHQFDPQFQYVGPTKVLYLSGRDID